MKKILSILTAAVMVSLLAVTAFASAILTEGDYNYSIEANGAYITIYHGTETEITVPEKIGGETVVGIKTTAFYNTDIVSVTLPATVTDIEEDAFLPSITVYQNEKTIIEAEEIPDKPVESSVSSKPVAPESDATEGYNAPDEATPDSEIVFAGISADGNTESGENADVAIRNGEEETAVISSNSADNSIKILTIVLIAVFAAAVLAVVLTIVINKNKKG